MAQGNLLVPDFGPLYGAPPDFERAAWRTPLELGAGAAARVLAVVFARRLSAVAPFASQVLLALQLVVLVVQQRMSWTSFADQGACVLARVGELLDRLRALGLYDRSAILLTADHGWRANRPDHPLRGILTPAGRLDLVAIDAMPLLAVKPPGAAGPLRTSHAPTALTDIPATVAALAGAPAPSLPGRPVFEIEAGAARPRAFAFHAWSDADWKRPYFDALLVFDVNGRVLDPSSWSFRQAILDPIGDFDEARGRLEIGLSGVRRANGEAFRWRARYAATFVPPGARTLRITARKDAATTSRAAVTVRLDGRSVGRLELAEDGWHPWTHPLEPRKDGRRSASSCCPSARAGSAACAPGGSSTARPSGRISRPPTKRGPLAPAGTLGTSTSRHQHLPAPSAPAPAGTLGTSTCRHPRHQHLPAPRHPRHQHLPAPRHLRHLQHDTSQLRYTPQVPGRTPRCRDACSP